MNKILMTFVLTANHFLYGINVKTRKFIQLTCLLPIVNQAYAIDTHCMRDRIVVDQEIRMHLPADPNTAKSAITMRQAGTKLCQEGQTKLGQEKLQKVVRLLRSEGMDTPLPQILKKEGVHP